MPLLPCPPHCTPRACQRWRAGRASYRPAGEPLDPHAYAVDLLSEASAKAFVCTHHYSRSYPAARLRVGLFQKTGGRPSILVGVAVFSVPMNQATIPKYTGLPSQAGIELGRFVLLDHVPANAESFFLARAFTLLHQTLPTIQSVLAYADPVPRVLPDGTIMTPGHLGTIYQATNAHYMGRSKARTLILTPQGTVLSERTLSKLRNEDRGAAGAYALLRHSGCQSRRPFEDSASYVRLATAHLARLRHPGNHAYVWPIGSPGTRRQIRRRFAACLPFPKALDPPSFLLTIPSE